LILAEKKADCYFYGKVFEKIAQKKKRILDDGVQRLC